MDVSSYLFLEVPTIEVRDRKDCRSNFNSGKALRRVNQEHTNNIHQTNCPALILGWVFFPLWVFSGCPLEENFLPQMPCLHFYRTEDKTEIKCTVVMLVTHKH